MNSDNHKTTQSQIGWSIPLWLKGLTAGLFISIVGILFRSLFSQQVILLGIPVLTVTVVVLLLLMILLPITISFWLYSESAFSLFCFWILRFLREQIYISALLGILYLLVIRATLFSLRGIAAYVILSIIFISAWYLAPADFHDIPHPALGGFFLSIRRLITTIESIPARIIRTIIAVLPVAIVCFVIYFVFGSTLSNYGPYSSWNDETSYWVWLRSFHFVGLNVGYNAPNELLSAFDFSRYGEASPVYLYVYGAITKVTGWFPVVPVLINFFLLSISIYFFLHIVKFDNWQVIFAGFAIILTWPVLLFLPVTTHETLNQAIGILIAAIFVKLLTNREVIGIWSKLGFVFFVYFAAWVRLSWGLMLIPVLFYCLKGGLLKRGVVAMLLGGMLYASVVVLMGYFLPRINNSILDTFRDSLVYGPQIVLAKMYSQFYNIFEYFNPIMCVVVQMIVVMSWSLSRDWKLLRSKYPLDIIFQDYSILDLFNMSSLLVAGLTFYIADGFYRTFAPAMLIVCLLQVMRRNYKHLVALLIINIFFFSSYMMYSNGVGDYAYAKADYTGRILHAPEIKSRIDEFMAYKPNVSSPWCNTLLIPVKFYDSRLILIPPGIGISYILRPETFQFPIKSRYVLFDPKTYQIYKDRSNLKLLVSLPIGDVYLNQDADCSSIQ